MRYFATLCICLSVTIVNSASMAATYCGNFEFSPMSDLNIYDQFERAVLRLKVRNQVGTGFLIDSQRGFILTAAHVIEPAIANPSVEILATSPAHPKTLLKLKLLKELSSSEQIDIALLQLEQPDALSDVNPIDISFRPVQEGSIVYVMGYPRSEKDLSKRRGEIEKITEDEGFVVKGDQFPGDSGSPLFTSTGVAIAIARSKIHTDVSYYTPMTDAIELLKQIPSTPHMKVLDERIRSNQIDVQELSGELKPRSSPSSTRNLELLSWAVGLAGRKEEYRAVRQFFDCPIATAFWHRNLDDAARFLKTIASRAIGIRTEIQLAQNANVLNRPTKAAFFLQTATDQLRYFDALPSPQDPLRLPVNRCDAAAFFALDPARNVREPRSAVAFMLSATEGQFYEAKRQGEAAVGAIVNIDFGSARQAAIKESIAQNFDLSDVRYSDYIAQSLAPESAELYSQCVALEAKEGKQFRIWVDKKDGSYVTLNAFWPGNGKEKTSRAGRTPVADNLAILKMPEMWAPGRVEQIVAKLLKSDKDGFLSVNVGGQQATVLVLGEPPKVGMLQEARYQEVVSTKNPKLCGQQVIESCLKPKKLQGYLLPGSGRIDFAGLRGAAGEITLNTPDAICAKIQVSSNFCESQATADVMLTAVERSPRDNGSIPPP
jgi:hypothetical protein